MCQPELWDIPVRSSNQTVPNAYTSEALKQTKRLGNKNNRKIRINFKGQVLSFVINTPNKDLDRVTKNYYIKVLIFQLNSDLG
jgi:hypothetical protein